MKAKDIAALIIAECNRPGSTYDSIAKIYCNDALTICAEALQLAAKRNSEASKVACLREGFTKWKSVVNHVHAAVPDSSIVANLYPKAMSHLAPPVFALCIRENVFLGYKPDMQDEQKTAQAIREIEVEAERDRVKSLIRDARKMGLNPEVIASQARAMGINID